MVIPIIQQGLFDVQGEWLSVDDVHAFLKQNFNYKEFEEYLDRCRAFADEFLNIIIPMPNEQVKIGY